MLKQIHGHRGAPGATQTDICLQVESTLVFLVDYNLSDNY